MPFRLLVYMVELMRRMFVGTDSKKRERKQFRLPAIVPLVLYNGASEWSCVRSFKEYLAGYELFAPNVIDFEYIMINVNEPAEAELIKIPTLMNLIMFIDRKGNPGSVLRRLRKALKISSRLTIDERIQLKDWIFDVLLKKVKNKVSKKEIEGIRNVFKKEEAEDMTYALERAIDAIERRGIRKGRLEGERKGELKGELKGKLATAKAMIANGLSWETAAKCSGIPVDELKKHLESSVAQ
jgi:hypothetical protein